MTRRFALSAALVLMLGTAATLAHDGHKHKIMGTVTALEAAKIDIKTPAGETLSIVVNDKTAIVRGKRKVALADIQVGHRVVVDVGEGETPLTAKGIQVGSAPSAK